MKSLKVVRKPAILIVPRDSNPCQVDSSNCPSIPCVATDTVRDLWDKITGCQRIGAGSKKKKPKWTTSKVIAVHPVHGNRKFLHNAGKFANRMNLYTGSSATMTPREVDLLMSQTVQPGFFYFFYLHEIGHGGKARSQTPSGVVAQFGNRVGATAPKSGSVVPSGNIVPTKPQSRVKARKRSSRKDVTRIKKKKKKKASKSKRNAAARERKNRHARERRATKKADKARAEEVERVRVLGESRKRDAERKRVAKETSLDTHDAPTDEEEDEEEEVVDPESEGESDGVDSNADGGPDAQEGSDEDEDFSIIEEDEDEDDEDDDELNDLKELGALL